MSLQIVCDLHLETPNGYGVLRIVPKVPYLALLGDIGNVAYHNDDCLAFLTRQLMQFQAVLSAPGITRLIITAGGIPSRYSVLSNKTSATILRWANLS